ncbi:MAG TPA: HGxxPAAW family protein [Actinocrinis sp.]|nr:HGxxPAAW family protein [Actinocrinis sp.]
MSNTPQADAGERPVSPVSPTAAPVPYHKPHYNHGHSRARWTGVVISSVGALVGGIAFPFHVWSVVYIGGALQLVALVVVVAMNAAGYGIPDVWGELKAEARAAKAGNGAALGAGPSISLPAPTAESQVKELSAH